MIFHFMIVGAVRKPGQPVYDLTYPPLFKLLSSSNLKHQETCAFVNFPADVNENQIIYCMLFLQHKKLPKDPTQVTDTSIGDAGRFNYIVLFIFCCYMK